VFTSDYYCAERIFLLLIERKVREYKLDITLLIFEPVDWSHTNWQSVYEIDFAIDLEFAGMGAISNYKFNYNPDIT